MHACHYDTVPMLKVAFLFRLSSSGTVLLPSRRYSSTHSPAYCRNTASCRGERGGG